LVSCEIRGIIADDERNANILKYRLSEHTPWWTEGIQKEEDPESKFRMTDRIRKTNKKLPPVREGVIYFLRFLNSSGVRPTSEIIFFSTPGDISRPGCFGTGKIIPSFIKITCDHFYLSIT
jgi:hypothetical protein